jgi:hypothetical protein
LIRFHLDLFVRESVSPRDKNPHREYMLIRT